MRCDGCGTENGDRSKFCNECGAPLRRASAGEAERRQITVLFLDLVGSTSMSEALDPEELRDVVRAYHDACSAVVRSFQGHVAQLLGDGVLVYFGYPSAQEDDVRRAVRAGLAVVEAMKGIRTAKGRSVDVRVGIHTGLVVVGELGVGDHKERLALGETPNLAARVQGEAAPGTVVVSGATLAIVRPFFEVEDLGPRMLKGLTTPVSLHRVRGETAVKMRTDVKALTPIVGRAAELAILARGWELAQKSEGRVVSICGEPGIGKSRLLQEIKAKVAPVDGQLAQCQCSPLHANSALFPLIDFLQQVMDLEAAEPSGRLARLQERLARSGPFAEEDVMLLASLLAIPHDRSHPVFALAPAEQRTKTMRSLVEWLLRAASKQPMLFVVEDAHWADPTTLELIDAVVGRTSTAPLLSIITYRPELRPTWGAAEHVTDLPIGPLLPADTEVVARHVAHSKDLPAEVVAQVVARTGGNPLFVEEMTKAVLETGSLRELDDRFELAGPAPAGFIPATLQDSLMARIDRLGPTKPLAQLASALGREFSYEVLRAVARRDDDSLRVDLSRMIDAELVYQQGQPPRATYLFKHALVRDAAYESLLRKTRQDYHRNIAETLRASFPEIAESQPDLMAIHYEGAGLVERAVDELRRAGERATARGAHRETVAHLEHALELLATLPAGPSRDRREMLLHADITPPYMAIKGWSHPDATRSAGRAYELSTTVGERDRIVPILWSLWANHFVSGDHPQSIRGARRTEDLALGTDNPTFHMMAYHALVGTLCARGEFEESAACIPLAEAAFDLERERALVLQIQLTSMGNCYGWGGFALWLAGRFAEAHAAHEKMRVLGLALEHAPSDAYMSWIRMVLLAAEGEAERVLALGLESLDVCRKHNFVFWEGVMSVYVGWARILLGRDPEASLAIAEEGYAGFRAVAPTGVALPMLATLVVEARARLGHRASALELVDAALALLEPGKPTQWFFFEARLLELRAHLLLGSPERAAEGESTLRAAVDRARAVRARAWELRASVSLARLLVARGDLREASALLDAAVSAVDATLETAHLGEARALRRELPSPRD